MIKKFLTKQLLKRQLKDVPAGQQEQILEMVEKKPELFKKIAEEVDRRVKKGGEDQVKASMEVMKKYRAELQEVLGE